MKRWAFLVSVSGITKSFLCTYKRIISSFLIVVLLLPTFAPVAKADFFGSQSVPEPMHERLVSVLISEKLVEGGNGKLNIDRFINDVQESAKADVIRVVVPDDADPFEIYEGNAALYYSGLKNDGRSQLIGTILIGEVPLPIVEKDGNLWPSVYPYVDFENKNYDYDFDKKRFVANFSGDNQPEIWHGVIRSGLDDFDIQMKELKAFFDENHKIHTGETAFDKKVFYADFSAQSALGDGLQEGNYDRWIDSLEDLSYERFTKSLLKKLQEDQAEDFEDKIDSSTIPKIDEDMLPDGYDWPPETETDSASVDQMPDILTKFLISKYAGNYAESMKDWLSIVNGRLEKSGRWEVGDLETTISLVAGKDQAAALRLKDANDLWENMMISVLSENNVAAKISVANELEDDSEGEATSMGRPLYWHGVSRAELTVDDCSMYRGSNTNKNGSGKIVEANRVFNSATAQTCARDSDDEDKRESDEYEGCCVDNLKSDQTSYSRCNPEVSRWDDGEYIGATKPIFDITGTAEREEGVLGLKVVIRLLRTMKILKNGIDFRLYFFTLSRLMRH